MDEIPINLPPQPTAFIGRADELSELSKLLDDPGCRLAALVGPGGSGKTRLAIEAARGVAGQFSDGVHFVPLEPVGSIEFLPAAIAESVGFSPRGQEEPRLQLFRYLEDKQLLIVLDSFEHLVTASPLLSDMLSAARRVKLIVTTREALKLSEEWVFPVPGLRYPEGDAVTDPGDYDAVRLFVERAQRVKRGYSPEADWPAIARICQLASGMPLAVELAASWVSVLTCDQIVGEIERNIDFLASSLRNVPERHRSVRAVFEQSWSLLDPEERTVFARLSVFRGSFGREAAEEVAGASLPMQSTLVDKSLLKPLPESRYRVHELLRQYSFEKLSESPGDVSSARDAHCGYYLDFVGRLKPDFLGHRQMEAAAEVDAEVDNIRAAWNWAVDGSEPEKLTDSIFPLAQYWQYRGRYPEALAALEGAAESLRNRDAGDEALLALAVVLTELGWFQIRLGRLEEAAATLADSLRIYRERRAIPYAAFATDPRLALAVLATMKGEYGEVTRLGEEARRISEDVGNEGNRSLAHYVLARAALLQGEYPSAKEHAQTAAEIATGTGDRWFLAYCLIELGNVALALQDISAARGYFQSSLDLRREFDDPEGMAFALIYLGEVALSERSYAEAQMSYEQAISIYESIHDKGGLATALRGRAKVAVAQGDYEGAAEDFRRAVKLATDIKHLTQVLSIISGTGELLIAKGNTTDGARLLELVLLHPASEHETKSWARRVLQGNRETASAGTSPPHGAGLAAVVAILRKALSIPPEVRIDVLLEHGIATAQPPPSSRPDGLTEREVEVLRLIAKGRSNRAIADELYITENTVANHVKNVLSKTQSANRTEAAAYAIAKKLV
jgi:predicted ATPase/DNA-binding CsgD family transcriptional regulator